MGTCSFAFCTARLRVEAVGCVGEGRREVVPDQGGNQRNVEQRPQVSRCPGEQAAGKEVVGGASRGNQSGMGASAQESSLEAIRARIASGESLRGVAKSLSISPALLSRRLKETSGESLWGEAKSLAISPAVGPRTY
jgi:hypothetical protein